LNAATGLHFALRAGHAIVGEYNDAAVFGAGRVNDRPGFA
jgi:hypothetical protein